MDQAKIKVSITLSPDLIREVDDAAKRLHSTRSSIVERWLRQAVHQQHEAKLRNETIAYYESLTVAERAEDLAIARASRRRARRLKVDD